MYELSRGLFRELAPLIIQTGDADRDLRTRTQVLEACERGVHRLATERDLRDPARTIFLDLRTSFHLRDQLAVRKRIEAGVARFMALARAREEHEEEREAETCAAYTVRRRKRCRRRPVEGSSYCSYHVELDSEEAEAPHGGLLAVAE